MMDEDTKAKFPKGAKVRLNIGGPEMVVADHDFARVTCQWFAGKKLESGRFAAESLIRIDEEGGQSPKA